MVDPSKASESAPSGPFARSQRVPARFTSRDVGSFFLVLMGLGIMATALVLNPWTGRLVWGVAVIDKRDVLTGYAITSLLLGGLIVYLGSRIGRQTDGRGDGVALLLVLVSLLVLADRLLLVNFGLPLWIHDPVLHYRHRPNAIRTLARAGRPNDRIEINAWGHHDTDFPEAKPEGEFRGLMIGDSVTMGDQLIYDETFSAQLERMLREEDPRFASYQIINTGVHGYATYQEVEILRESLRFAPDFVAIGFCMNDLTEPSVVARGFEKADRDYHHVVSTTSPLQGFFLNETGFGRLVQELRSRSTSLNAERMSELDGVRSVARADRTDPRWREVWDWVLRDLEEMYSIARSADAETALLIFPFTFQLLDESARMPQAILTEHARRHGVPVLDFTGPFADRIYADRELLALLRERGFSNDRIERIFGDETRRYFLDNDHLTPAGHEVVARALFELLRASPGRTGTRPADPSDREMEDARVRFPDDPTDSSEGPARSGMPSDPAVSTRKEVAS